MGKVYTKRGYYTLPQQKDETLCESVSCFAWVEASRFDIPPCVLL